MTDNDDSILHDFSDQTLKVSMYGGAAGKRTMDYHGHRYMVKFGYCPDRTGHADCPVSEFIGSKVFAAADHPHPACPPRHIPGPAVGRLP